MKRILISLEMTEDQKALFEELQELEKDNAEFRYYPEKGVTADDVRWADAAVGRLSSAVIAGADLDWVQIAYTGVDHFLAEGILAPRTVLTNCPGVFGHAVCEQTVCMTLNLMKETKAFLRQQEAHEWKRIRKLRSVDGKTVLILGMGDLGKRYARVMKAMGATTVGIRRRLSVLPPEFDEQGTNEEIARFLPKADIVAMFLPGNAEAFHFMNEERLRLMKPDAVLVNAGRGDSIDSAALKKVLREGLLGGVGLDVTEPEPLPADDELWDIDRVIITPHAVGYSSMEGVMDRIVPILLENIRRYAEGEPLTCVVKPAQ